MLACLVPEPYDLALDDLGPKIQAIDHFTEISREGSFINLRCRGSGCWGSQCVAKLVHRICEHVSGLTTTFLEISEGGLIDFS